jgi:hypothetical protein
MARDASVRNASMSLTSTLWVMSISAVQNIVILLDALASVKHLLVGS